MTYSRISVPGFVLAIWLALSSLQGVAAVQTKRATIKGKTLICNTDANGEQHCTEKISPAVIAAIIVTTVGIILLAIGVWFFIRRSRNREGNVEDQFQVDASQMQGPPPIVGVTAVHSSRKRGKGKQANTTYTARYDPSSAPVLPQLAYAAGSAPVFSMSNAGPPSAPLAARMGGAGSSYGYGPGSAGPYGTPPQTAPNGKGFGQGKTPYPFVGISSSQHGHHNNHPSMSQAGGPSYVSGGYGNRI